MVIRKSRTREVTIHKGQSPKVAFLDSVHRKGGGEAKWEDLRGFQPKIMHDKWAVHGDEQRSNG